MTPEAEAYEVLQQLAAAQALEWTLNSDCFQLERTEGVSPERLAAAEDIRLKAVNARDTAQDAHRALLRRYREEAMRILSSSPPGSLHADATAAGGDPR